jgi:hypothetical protein
MESHACRRGQFVGLPTNYTEMTDVISVNYRVLLLEGAVVTIIGKVIYIIGNFRKNSSDIYK